MADDHQVGPSDAPSGGDGNLPDGSLTTFCHGLSGPVTFCRDFDDGQRFDQDFLPTKPYPNNLSLDSTNPYSHPSCLLAFAPKASPQGQMAYMVHPFDILTATDIRLSFELFQARPTVPDDGQDSQAKVIRLGFAEGAPNGHAIALVHNLFSDFIEEYSPRDAADAYTQHLFQSQASGMLVDHWYKIEIRISTSTRHLMATLDGTTVVDDSLNGIWPPSQVSLAMGIIQTGGSNAEWSYRYDNIVLDLK